MDKTQIVATLNFSENNYSPFEFNDNTPEIAFLDEVFTRELERVAAEAKWGDVANIYTYVNKLSQHYQAERFSPLYNRLTESFITSENVLSLNAFRKE